MNGSDTVQESPPPHELLELTPRQLRDDIRPPHAKYEKLVTASARLYLHLLYDQATLASGYHTTRNKHGKWCWITGKSSTLTMHTAAQGFGSTLSLFLTLFAGFRRSNRKPAVSKPKQEMGVKHSGWMKWTTLGCHITYLGEQNHPKQIMLHIGVELQNLQH